MRLLIAILLFSNSLATYAADAVQDARAIIAESEQCEARLKRLANGQFHPEDGRKVEDVLIDEIKEDWKSGRHAHSDPVFVEIVKTKSAASTTLPERTLFLREMHDLFESAGAGLRPMALVAIYRAVIAPFPRIEGEALRATELEHFRLGFALGVMAALCDPRFSDVDEENTPVIPTLLLDGIEDPGQRVAVAEEYLVTSATFDHYRDCLDAKRGREEVMRTLPLWVRAVIGKGDLLPADVTKAIDAALLPDEQRRALDSSLQSK